MTEVYPRNSWMRSAYAAPALREPGSSGIVTRLYNWLALAIERVEVCQ
jgi:hypothetical protein